ncbi:DUF3108 domain-containing protein [Persephonella sp.]
MWRILIVLLFMLGPVYGEEVRKRCYTVSYLFIEVGRFCITYDANGSEIKTTAEATTTGIIKLLKDIHYEGNAVADSTFRSKSFYFLKKERSIIEIHRYRFENNIILFKKEIIQKGDIKVTEKTFKNRGYMDPFTASLYYYNRILSGKKVTKKIFYNGKSYLIPYTGRKEVQISGIKAIYAEIDPSSINVGGLIQPSGVWKLWIDTVDGMLLKAELKIKVGTVKIEKI